MGNLALHRGAQDLHTPFLLVVDDNLVGFKVLTLWIGIVPIIMTTFGLSSFSSFETWSPLQAHRLCSSAFQMFRTFYKGSYTKLVNARPFP